MTSIHIASPQNQRIKDVRKLDKRNERSRRRVTVVEGTREVASALRSGIVPVEAYVCQELMVEPEGIASGVMLSELAAIQRTTVFTVTEDVYARLAMRTESGGILLVIPYISTDIQNLAGGDAPFFLVVEGAEKPGNLGAVLRTADAAGVDGVIVVGGTDVHNPNVVRASLGTLFSVPLAETTSVAAIAWLQARGVRIVAATPAGAKIYTDADLRDPLALVVGSESSGLSEAWLAAADQRVYIPMLGQADSLNLAASTAILAYEVVRQRGL